jgi:hypothetical protein
MARLARELRRHPALTYDPYPNRHADTPPARQPISSARRRENVAALRLRHLSPTYAAMLNGSY